jgi:septum site-determining protein MinC
LLKFPEREANIRNPSLARFVLHKQQRVATRTASELEIVGAKSAEARATLEIRSIPLTALALGLTSSDAEEFARQLEAKLAAVPDFFSGEPVLLDLRGIEDRVETPDFAGLIGVLRAHGLCAAGVRGGTPEQQLAARDAGLGAFAAVPERKLREREAVRPEPRGATPSATPRAPAEKPSARPARIIEKPVRSGQQIYAQGADLVVAATVNAGAEILADGHVHVYAPLRGRALAGVSGNREARIFCQSMEAELVAIAGYYRVLEQELPPEVRGRPAQVALRDERIVITAL